jgi:hypothetical protein
VAARDLAKLGCALLLGAAVAFPAGLMVAGSRDGADRADTAARGDAAVRDVFSPSIRRDPWFLERQREGVEALERHCERTGESCPEARAARHSLAELEAAD